jgi:hypothetical protein
MCRCHTGPCSTPSGGSGRPCRQPWKRQGRKLDHRSQDTFIRLTRLTFIRLSPSNAVVTISFPSGVLMKRTRTLRLSAVSAACDRVSCTQASQAFAT